MRLLAIDPGSEHSAWVELDAHTRKPYDFNITQNRAMCGILVAHQCETCVCEWMEPRGMPTAKQEFETAFWVGRFCQAWSAHADFFERVKRQTVKHIICGNMAARDSNIRQAIIDRYPASGRTGKGEPSAIGTKKQPGPLYGIKRDMWQALAVGLTWLETRKEEEK